MEQENKGGGIIDILTGRESFKTENVITFDNTLYYILGFAFVLGVILVIVSKRVK